MVDEEKLDRYLKNVNYSTGRAIRILAMRALLTGLLHTVGLSRRLRFSCEDLGFVLRKSLMKNLGPGSSIVG